MDNKLMVMPQKDMKEMAVTVCKSGLFPMPSPEAAFTLMMICQSEGLHPIQALKRYHVIKGRPTMRSDAMLAEFQRAGGKIKWLKRDENEVEAEFSHESGGTVPVKWTMEMAKKAGLASKDVWRQFPRQMLTARVISEGVRTILPGIVTGIYCPEEITHTIPDDIEDATPAMTIDQVAAMPAEPTPEPEPEAAPKPKPAKAEKWTCLSCGRTSDNPGLCKCAQATPKKPEPKPEPEPQAAPTGLTKTQAQGKIVSLRAKNRVNTEDFNAILSGVGASEKPGDWSVEDANAVLAAMEAKYAKN